MPNPIRIGLIGDFSPDVRAHKAIPPALMWAGEAQGCTVASDWLATETLVGDVSKMLRAYDGLWCVPASPYRNMDGALAAIRFARENRRPFLGTCGGFQHAVIEYARNVWGLRDADHAESNPAAETLIVSPLSCSLVGTSGAIHFRPGSKIAAAYGREQAVESYHCNHGFNREYVRCLEQGPLAIVGTDDAGDVRAVELADHPFFIATLYQPELSTLSGGSHPLINAFATSAVELTRVPVVG